MAIGAVDLHAIVLQYIADIAKQPRARCESADEEHDLMTRVRRRAIDPVYNH